MLTTPFPETDSPELERYTLYSRGEIVAMLRQLQRARLPVTIFAGAPGNFALTRLLAVKPDFEELVFELPLDPAQHALVLSAGPLVLVAFLELVKLQFGARAAESIEHDGRPALRVRLPGEMLRLQRRDFFRVRTPTERPPTCLVSSGSDARQYESVLVSDVSVGGMAMITYPERISLPDTGLIENCFLDLPGIGSINVSLRLRRVESMEGAGAPDVRCGCEFVGMSPQGQMMLQRYVNRVGAEQRGRLDPALDPSPVDSAGPLCTESRAVTRSG
jgi:c-di-GMP-binding flagellar brake protein YcgR